MIVGGFVLLSAVDLSLDLTNLCRMERRQRTGGCVSSSGSAVRAGSKPTPPNVV